ncbi:CLUMA_CG009509, isoform A [Clunio marinus]|uniref:CLUMA_CG009509, isoform A n=1 Tax=Clunio marinus TaxID=568069 RepID=A0A1J1ICB3_9DIPT|nr:CLUMA_CG009509, isoform A [Clunio marinus]
MTMIQIEKLISQGFRQSQIVVNRGRVENRTTYPADPPKAYCKYADFLCGTGGFDSLILTF